MCGVCVRAYVLEFVRVCGSCVRACVCECVCECMRVCGVCVRLGKRIYTPSCRHTAHEIGLRVSNRRLSYTCADQRGIITEM